MVEKIQKHQLQVECAQPEHGTIPNTNTILCTEILSPPDSYALKFCPPLIPMY